LIDNIRISETLRHHLELALLPIAVSLLSSEDNPELEVDRPKKPVASYCQAIMAAARGERFYLLKNDILCKPGAATLGFCKYPEDMLSGQRHYRSGVFCSIKAAKKGIAGACKLEDESIQGLLLRPVSQADNDYDVLLIPVNAEQAMFISVADKYETGGRTEISMATGFQGICGDATAYVLQTGSINLSVTGFEDRLRCGLGPDLMMAGIPKNRVSIIAGNLEKLGTKLLAKYKKARSGEKSQQ
jgi:uncharacterized protein (DUF169 family)